MFSLAGVAITLVNLPGLWLIVGLLGIYELLTHHAFASCDTLLAMLIAAAIAESGDHQLRAIRQRRRSRRGIWGAILGAIIGGIASSRR